MKKILAIIAFTVFLTSSADKTRIWEFRGEDRLGFYPDRNLLAEWPSEGPPEYYTVENLGNGFVSPVFTDTDFYISGEADSMLILHCFDLEGKKKWQSTIGKEYLRSYPGSRCAPTIAGELIYIGTGLGNLYCLDRKNGNVLWSKDLVKDFDGVLPLHGYSEAPLIDGDKVFWTPGGKKNNVVALDRFTGKLLWSCPGFGERSAYNPPRIISHGGKRILVTFSAYHLMGIDVSNGRLLWGHEQDNYPLRERQPGYGDTHCNTVIYDKGFIYYVAGDGNCAVKLALSADGTSVKELWRNKRFDSYMGGVVKIGDYLYCGGNASPSLLSLNTASGILTDSLRLGTGALIAADNMIYYYSQKGDMTLVRYNNGKIDKISTFRIKKGDKQHFSHPVINKGILYQRHGNVLMAFDIRKKQ